MPLPATPPPATYGAGPWWGRYLETMPGWLLLTGGVVALVMWLLKKPIEEVAANFFDGLFERIKQSSKEQVSAADMACKARKAIILEQAAERLRLKIDCDHVSVYGCQNGEYHGPGGAGLLASLIRKASVNG